MKWVVFVTAPDQLTAEMWRDIVRQEGIACELRPGDTTSFLGVSQIPVRLVTTEAERERALEALSGTMDGTSGAPE